jgi:hypothetical protein
MTNHPNRQRHIIPGREYESWYSRAWVALRNHNAMLRIDPARARLHGRRYDVAAANLIGWASR